jgi:PmbA protein
MKARETGERAGEMAVHAKNPILGEEGKLDLVVEPLLTGSLMHFTQDMLSALVVEIGQSMFAKRIGKQVASKLVTLADDPLMDTISRRAFDHEGVPTRRNVLIKNGVLKGYMHNTSTAKRFRAKTTANAGPLIPTMFNITAQPLAFHPVVEEGDWTTEEMISDTKDGLYLNNTWYTRFQSHETGDFSTIPRDAILRIQDGEIVGAVKNIRISDNLMNFWKSVDALSKKREQVAWWDEASPPSTLPVLRIRSMSITRSS